MWNHTFGSDGGTEVLVIKVVLCVALVAAVLWGLMRLIRYCNTVAYPYQPFTRGVFIGVAVAYGAMLSGASWYASALRTHGDALNGVALMALGAALLAWIVLRHVRGTSLLVGLGISAVQLPLFAVLAYFGLVVLVIGFALTVMLPAVMGAINPTVVRVVNY